MVRADGVTGEIVETCGCGCGSMTVGESQAHNTCGCGCGSSETAAPKTREEEIAELQALRESIDRRLQQLAS